MFSDPDTLDPGRSDDEQKNAIVLEIQETLIRLMDGKVTPGGAESWETSDDGLVWTFKLRDNQYSDGTAVTAQDYVNSIRRIFDPEVNCHNVPVFSWFITGNSCLTWSSKQRSACSSRPSSTAYNFSHSILPRGWLS